MGLKPKIYKSKLGSISRIKAQKQVKAKFTKINWVPVLEIKAQNQQTQSEAENYKSKLGSIQKQQNQVRPKFTKLDWVLLLVGIKAQNQQNQS